MVQNEMILKNSTFHKNNDGIIFQNYSGNYLTPSTVRGMLNKYCNGAGVEYKGLHAFRHTHAILLLEAGAKVKFIADRLGHGTTVTTNNTYLDITKKIEKDELLKFVNYTSRRS